MQEEKATAYTFALTGFPLPPFITRRRRRTAEALRDTLDGLEGMIGISLCGKIMFVHMESKNDAIIAQNRLLYCGFAVSEEINKTILDMKTRHVRFDDDEEDE